MSKDKIEDLNELGAKLIKAELLGDDELAASLRERLENARKASELTKPEPSASTSRKPQNYPREKFHKHKNHRYDNEEAKMFKRNYKNDEYDDLNYDDFSVTSSKKLKNEFVHQTDQKFAQNKEKEEKKSAENCSYCFDSTQKHLVISIGKHCYLCLPNSESIVDGSCMIVPMSHCYSSVTCDEDVWQEIDRYKKALVEMFDKRRCECVFYEMYTNENKYGHMVIQCVPLDMNVSNLAPIYFKKAIIESESEWSTNKKLIELKDKTIRSTLPKNVPYFTVSFGSENGFAHIIEKNEAYPAHFAKEIIAGIIDLDPMVWMRPRKESFGQLSKKVIEFSKWWKAYEFNKN
ncbi:CWF19 2 isoform X2 [Brachionus plicatilis]|uniref:CWF19 2 isoform X2 n=1 Tax=Brachionus plicatilis TaxID=10195 RepID=A0A3M7T3W3_BRAPC|nr:CWF19 2 isoform X2 [Brachionus plicatilis]